MYEELTQEEQDIISEQIKQGFISGLIGGEIIVSWELTYNKFKR